jgi:hypothetical protein
VSPEALHPRIADVRSAKLANPNLAPAIHWLQSRTPIGRLSEIEIWETLHRMTEQGGFSITHEGNPLP